MLIVDKLLELLRKFKLFWSVGQDNEYCPFNPVIEYI